MNNNNAYKNEIMELIAADMTYFSELDNQDIKNLLESFFTCYNYNCIDIFEALSDPCFEQALAQKYNYNINHDIPYQKIFPCLTASQSEARLSQILIHMVIENLHDFYNQFEPHFIEFFINRVNNDLDDARNEWHASKLCEWKKEKMSLSKLYNNK